MRCEEFQERLNDCIDAGSEPLRDRRIRRHAFRCAECRRDLETWQCIAQSVAPASVAPAKQSWLVLPVALAAGVCLVLFGYWRSAGDVDAVALDRPAAEFAASEKTQQLAARPPQWSDPRWSDPEWVDRWADRVAEPLVPLSQGLAPLGRSFQTAFTLLVLPDAASEAEVQPTAQPLQSEVLSRLPEVNYA